MDCLFINPNSSQEVYQELANENTAIEVPVWSLLLAEACRKEFNVNILDCDAEKLSDDLSILRIQQDKPRIVCFVVYGQNPNSGTTNMTGAIRLAKKIKESYNTKIAFIGSHTSALPQEVLSYKCVDYVMVGDGLNALKNLLKSDLKNISKISGLGWKDQFGIAQFNSAACSVNNLDEDLPGYAWDLLPYDKKPFDLYRSHFWHANFDKEKRKNAAAIYTSLGCSFSCQYCMISVINATDFTNKSATELKGMKFWSPEKVLSWFDNLIAYGVTTVRLSDEMFFLNKKYFEPILKGLVDRGYGDKLHMWAYARIDTVQEKYLELFKNAGIKWLALGIESANKKVRTEVTKGKFEDNQIIDIVNKIRQYDINVIGNYMYGLPDDNWDTMQETLNMALELNTEMYNGYAASALPGSKLHQQALQEGWDLPDSFEGYSFHSYECKPLSTKYLGAADVLAFRDYAWQTYMTNPRYLNLVKNKFGEEAVQNIKDMSKIKLKRQILGD